MVLVFFVYLIGGSFIDDLAFMILATPIFFPIMAKLGYDPLLIGIYSGPYRVHRFRNSTRCHLRLCGKKYYESANGRNL